jgi:hypothetical protein
VPRDAVDRTGVGRLRVERIGQVKYDDDRQGGTATRVDGPRARGARADAVATGDAFGSRRVGGAMKIELTKRQVELLRADARAHAAAGPGSAPAAHRRWQAILARLDRAAAAAEPRDPPANSREIDQYMHCTLCLDELNVLAMTKGWASWPDYVDARQAGRATLDPALNPAEHARLEAGWTALGFQVWCRRHDVNVIHVDFEGAQHPANATRR